VPRDDRESAHWFKLAADQGQTEAEYNLGVLRANGQGVSRDDAEAVRWYRLAAERGHRDAQFNLAVLYANGRGTARDLVQAEKWFQIAARAGDRDAETAQERLAERMSAQEIEESKALAAAWTPCKTKPECDAISDTDSRTQSSAPKNPR
jgi:TPR repeat protein